MACGCTKKKMPTSAEQAALKQAEAESRAQALARFRQERQQRIVAQQRKTNALHKV